MTAAVLNRPAAGDHRADAFVDFDAAELLRPAKGWRVQVRPPGLSEKDDPIVLMPEAVASFAFEHATPIRKFGSWRGMSNWHCRFPSLKTGQTAVLESRAELRVCLRLEASASVAAWAWQPCRFHYRIKGDKRVRSRVVDAAVRMVDSSLLLVDVSHDVEADGPLRRLKQRAAMLFAKAHNMAYRVMQPLPRAVEASLWAAYSASRYPRIDVTARPMRALRNLWNAGALAERTDPLTIDDLQWAEL